MKKNELFYTLALQSARGIGPVTAKKLLDHFGTVGAVFKNIKSEKPLLRNLAPELLAMLKSKETLKRAEKELKFLEKNNVRAIGFDDPDYPVKLRHCADAPLLLFQKGNININEKRVISIVGTRMMTAYGALFLKEFIRDLKPYEPVIVSGLAFGIDICAHEEALKNGIQTVGILGHGLDRIYPSQHKDIARKMLQKGGFYTEFWSGSTTEKINFIKRNRIIAGISEATIVVESASVGGSLATARFASSYDRDVMAVPGRTNDRFSEGCNMMIKGNQASMLTSAKDLEYVLGWSCETSVLKPIQKALPFELDREEKVVYELLSGSEKKLLDTIARECGLGVHKTVGILLQLELKGMVSSHSGKRFRTV